jgi:hypothetical protein
VSCAEVATASRTLYVPTVVPATLRDTVNEPAVLLTKMTTLYVAFANVEITMADDEVFS